ncbi:MAG: peptide-methionine (S)-S-oxide reductase MsrA [Alkalibacterium gilvum]|uniref:Peptide methionine sulfoxide reductase MsrA n=1 Tax=Alkalibacterium gilvum TaxID=1130080 RepID=A0A1H6R688_9LACT|nr:MULTISPECIES: peptide-methionine (S)-S-oxide reductase MsrA [Alkalibacterium]MDN6293661.1 peptide-methionine (S)-S-oxide reductase MsrA [Alkalibacterium sp.]MDN6295290.1 peptide-methionine (S)-S-oxide reductase MsrA [Alkalibacterium sp.]MDN6729139.1 peptide-methionine (S)-S-oxide reductase MsrA [Alkalibacterium sp.]SEI49976.1 peptide-methionine (S)-S-oxide reductase [Alkalibacterium gilvum]
MEKAIFAGGCFWCMVQPFETMSGIEKVVSGYTGGHVENPTYEEVKSQKTGHTEAVLIHFDEKKLSYEELLTIYWQQTDPTDAMGQFMDRGDSYRPVIFYNDDEQKKKAIISRMELQNSNHYSKPIVTTIEKAGPFYPAEEEHQQFHIKNPDAYAKEKEQRRQWADLQL